MSSRIWIEAGHSTYGLFLWLILGVNFTGLTDVHTAGKILFLGMSKMVFLQEIRVRISNQRISTFTSVYRHFSIS